jgi:Fe-S-cluster-containing dehydrogenase component/CRP-like cAMP-binding protein
MPLDANFIGGPSIRDNDEGFFSRDATGQLIRLDAPTEQQYGENVTIQIDGQPVTVPIAQPSRDAAGNIIQNLEGETTPRLTTIYDAVLKLYVKEQGDESKIPIPTLCHQSHMTPVAVCRLCVVQLYGPKRGKRTRERKLLPACQHPVKKEMEVFTKSFPGREADAVRQSVKVLTELLAADHLKPAATPSLAKELDPYDELGQMVQLCGASPSRYKIDALSDPAPVAPPLVGRRQLDASSPVFLVNHSACILCERCIRACNDVVKHHVIGRTGKGNTAGISFDLNYLMGESSCVKCGECMVSCPTSAITFKPTAQVRPAKARRFGRVVPAAELIRDPIFAGIPPKFLLWQRGLVIRRRFRAGQTLFRQGDPGNTAFLIRSGKLRVTTQYLDETLGGAISRLLGKPLMRFDLGPENLIVGEMACLSGSPRTATLKGVKSGEVWELRRNVLDRLMRLPSHRERLEKEYRDRALHQVLPHAEIFKNLETREFRRIVEYLQPRITFVRVNPGQMLFHQEDLADAMYMVRLGHVRVGLRRFEGEMKVISLGPGTVIGEIGLLGFSFRDAALNVQQADLAIKTALERAGGDLGAAIPPGQRTATCAALGHLELARLDRVDFLQLLRDFPVLRRRLVEQSLARLRSDNERNPLMREYVAQGLYEGQSLLILDLERCTRCDECVKACVQQHGTQSHGVPVTRLLRDGLHFASLMVATACRSCTDAYCMIGCPVDSIHRGRHGQIVIEDHCIGCGLCATNCPYGNIFMAPNERHHFETLDPSQSGRIQKMAPLKASTCDLCDSVGELSTPYPRCVAACPHDAAFRMTGDELLSMVTQRGNP